ncbi:MAG: trigger factor [Clostridiales bacterium]|nr:trigger factor [Clostridiales bacterium]
MSLQVENLEEKNMAKLTIEVSAEEFEKAIEKAYQKNKGKMSVPGFRKGKVPRKMIEKMYGVGVFYEDAANEIIPEAYASEIENCDLDIVSQPKIDVVQIEEGKSFIFTAEVATKPDVELGEYKGIEVEKKTAEVTAEEVDAELEKERDKQSRLVPVEGRAVADGDSVTIDFEGFVDGVAFDGGKGTDYALTIGSHSFIDTFEDQLVGKNIGDDVEVNVTFPEQYQAEELQGKAAMFKVQIKGIKEKQLPELDDDFAQDVSDFDTLAEYKEDLKKKLLEKKEEEVKAQFEEEVVEKVVANAKMDIPEAMVELQVRQMAENFARRMSSQGLTMEQYMQFTGLTPDKLTEQMRPQAVKTIESRLVLEAIVKAENIEASEDEFKAELEKMAAMYQMEVDKLSELVSDKEKESMKLDIAVQKAVDFIVEQAK